MAERHFAILHLCRGREFGILTAMKKMFFLFLAVSCAAIACADGMTDYCHDVVEPALAGVFAAKWTPRGPDAESVAAVCTNVDWRIVRRRRSRIRDVWIGGTAPTNGTPWRLGVSRTTNGSFVLNGRLWPFETSPCAVTNTCATNAHVRLVARAADALADLALLFSGDACGAGREDLPELGHEALEEFDVVEIDHVIGFEKTDALATAQCVVVARSAHRTLAFFHCHVCFVSRPQ